MFRCIGFEPLHRYPLNDRHYPQGCNTLPCRTMKLTAKITANKWLINNLSRQSCQNFFTSPIVLRLVHLTWNYFHRFGNLLGQRFDRFRSFQKDDSRYYFHLISDLLRWKSSSGKFSNRNSILELIYNPIFTS